LHKWTLKLGRGGTQKGTEEHDCAAPLHYPLGRTLNIGDDRH